jgi:hypothetical protein
MSVGDIRRYVANGQLGPAAAAEQIELLTAQQQRLAVEADQIALRKRYVELKIDYWHAVKAGDDGSVQSASCGELRPLAPCCRGGVPTRASLARLVHAGPEPGPEFQRAVGKRDMSLRVSAMILCACGRLAQGRTSVAGAAQCCGNELAAPLAARRTLRIEPRR